MENPWNPRLRSMQAAQGFVFGESNIFVPQK